MRVDGVLYTSVGPTHRQASRYASAEKAECHDTGRDPGGSVFADDPERLDTWAFDGYPPTKVLGVRWYGNDLGVFIADAVPAEERERIHEDLANSG